MTMDKRYSELKSMVDSMEGEFKKFNDKKIKTSGKRVRNSLLSCKKMCDVLRREIQAELKSMPVSSRVVKKSPPIPIPSKTAL
tara:strand:- start:2351 stop:2599 length:249 start_codon:yes stop_codon:yes gene_type:complete